MKIGFYDSGIGGLSVLQTAMEMLPNEEFIYYADTDHVPYGEKSNDEILAFARRAVDFLIAKDAKAIVIACNTATSVAAKYLRAVHTLPIIGMEPAVKPAVEEKNHKRILVSATPVTIREKKLPCQTFVAKPKGKFSAPAGCQSFLITFDHHRLRTYILFLGIITKQVTSTVGLNQLFIGGLVAC